jgi:hypothetical protein
MYLSWGTINDDNVEAAADCGVLVGSPTTD